MKLSVLVLLMFLFFTTAATAQTMEGTDYKVKEGEVSLGGPGASSETYNLRNIIGVNAGKFTTSLYNLLAGLLRLNRIPTIAITSYNSGKPTDDETPTFQWTYSDLDNDTQKKYQVQVGHPGFVSPVVNTGIVSSAATSYTPTTPLSSTAERTLYKWRVRVHDGWGWSGWYTATRGFFLGKEELVITGLAALTDPPPRGQAITESSWQNDNDPYFYWQAPSEEIDFAGYSYSLDELPDEFINTGNTFHFFAEDGIEDGQHTFYVQAQRRSSGLWTEPASFEIWVDTIAPKISALTPASGEVLGTDTPTIGATISDTASGVNPTSIEMRINKALVSSEEIEYDPESGELTYTPSTPLSEGEVTVSLEVEDLAGNSSGALVWTFTVDTEGPRGSLQINGGDRMTTIHIVTLTIEAEDATSDVVEMMLSNDGVFDTEKWQAYTSLVKDWALDAISGTRTVYAKLKDEAGNESAVFVDQIELVIIAPDTYILAGPSGITEERSAEFRFGASMDDCQFRYKFDDDDWSEWSTDTAASKAGLEDGNHYFWAQAAKDLNADGLFQLNEIDPTPAQRVWTIGEFRPPAEPEKPIKLWEQQ